MIGKKINRKLLIAKMELELSCKIVHWGYSPDSYVVQCHTRCKPVGEVADELMSVFDDVTLPLVQKNINSALTCSKHLLMYDKQDLIWFQQSLARMKNARGAFKD